MKTAKDLMLAYIEGTAEESGALFSPDGTLELPYLASIGLPPVLKGPGEITDFLTFLHGTLYPGFSFQKIQIHLSTPDQAFAEYFIDHDSAITGKHISQQFFGHLQSKDGQIVRLREAVDVILVAEAIFPKGLSEVIAKR